MKVNSLFLKVVKGQPMLQHDKISLQKGLGIDGDINAHCLSPRQVLLTRLEEAEGFGIKQGDLRENIVVSGLSELDFAPGSELVFSSGAKIRLS
jgi:MOSC domain-containing protein YiiM